MLNSDVDLHCGNVRHGVCLHTRVAGGEMSDKLRAAAQAAYGIEKARQWVRGTLGTAHLKEFDDFIKEGL